MIYTGILARSLLNHIYRARRKRRFDVYYIWYIFINTFLC